MRTDPGASLRGPPSPRPRIPPSPSKIHMRMHATRRAGSRGRRVAPSFMNFRQESRASAGGNSDGADVARGGDGALGGRGGPRVDRTSPTWLLASTAYSCRRERGCRCRRVGGDLQRPGRLEQGQPDVPDLAGGLDVPGVAFSTRTSPTFELARTSARSRRGRISPTSLVTSSSVSSSPPSSITIETSPGQEARPGAPVSGLRRQLPSETSTVGRSAQLQGRQRDSIVTVGRRRGAHDRDVADRVSTSIEVTTAGIGSTVVVLETPARAN